MHNRLIFLFWFLFDNTHQGGGGLGNKEIGWSDNNLQNWPSSSLGHDLTPGNDRHGSVQVKFAILTFFAG